MQETEKIEGKHTPPTWTTKEAEISSQHKFHPRYKATIYYEDGNPIATVHMGGAGALSSSKEDVEANAAHIVKCVNSHAELVEALEAMVRYQTDKDYRAKVESDAEHATDGNITAIGAWVYMANKILQSLNS